MNYKKIFFFLILIPHLLFSQEEKSITKKRIGIASSYSYSGINAMLGFSLVKNKNEIGLGIRTSLSHFSSYSNSTFMGMCIEYNHTISENKKINSFVNVQYANLFRKLSSPISNEKSIFQLHELYIGYGLSYKIQKLYIINTINYGGYFERQKNFYNNEPSLFFHSGPMIQLSLKYEL